MTTGLLFETDFCVSRSAVFSPDRVYRYTLWRVWDTALPYVQVIGLNPSKADERDDDKTVGICVDYARRWVVGGTRFGALCMTNIFAYCATDPRVMKAYPEPVGPDNDLWLRRISEGAGRRVAAWGTDGDFLGRGRAVVELLGAELYCLRRTKDGHPHHPLYLPMSLTPVPFNF